MANADALNHRPHTIKMRAPRPLEPLHNRGLLFLWGSEGLCNANVLQRAMCE